MSSGRECHDGKSCDGGTESRISSAHKTIKTQEFLRFMKYDGADRCLKRPSHRLPLKPRILTIGMTDLWTALATA